MATSGSDIEQRIQERIVSDPQFREALKNDPKGALEQAFGLQIPPHITLKTVENTQDTRYIVLPEQTSGQALSDEALEGVAGGLEYSWSCGGM